LIRKQWKCGDRDREFQVAKRIHYEWKQTLRPFRLAIVAFQERRQPGIWNENDFAAQAARSYSPVANKKVINIALVVRSGSFVLLLNLQRVKKIFTFCLWQVLISQTDSLENPNTGTVMCDSQSPTDYER
jgi:hypothetical protein